MASSADGSNVKLTPAEWPSKWVREETFWREMTTRTLSALLSASILFVTGRSVGLFKEIPWSTVGLWGGSVLLVVAFLFAYLRYVAGNSFVANSGIVWMNFPGLRRRILARRRERRRRRRGATPR